MMVINSDELKPYLRGESEGDSINDPSLLQDSNDDTSGVFPGGVCSENSHRRLCAGEYWKRSLSTLPCSVNCRRIVNCQYNMLQCYLSSLKYIEETSYSRSSPNAADVFTEFLRVQIRLLRQHM